MKTPILLLTLSVMISGEIIAQRPTNQAGGQVQHNSPAGTGKPAKGKPGQQKRGVSDKQEVDPRQIHINGEEPSAPNRISVSDKKEIDPRQIHIDGEEEPIQTRVSVSDKQEIDPRQIHMDESMENPTAITNTSSIELVVYPNPATELLIIQTGETESAGISIIDLGGRAVMAQPHTPGANSIRLDVGGLPRGIYFVQMELNGQRLTKKILLT